MLIGEAPGREEDKGGRPFIGQAGAELNDNYLVLAGLKREDTYFTNSVKCRPLQNKTPKDHEIETCGKHFIPGEVLEVQPEIVFLLGASACRLVGGVDLDAQHGIPFKGELFGWECWLVPMYHPAAGLHNTTMMIYMLEDWKMLKPWITQGVWQWPIDKYEGKRDYKLARTPQDVDDYFHKYDWVHHSLMGSDTESHARKPWSIQISRAPGTGLMVLLEDRHDPAVKALTGYFGHYMPVFHNAEADIDIIREFGGWIGDRNYIDTMQVCYQLQRFKSQGLKSLALRVLGRKRQSWEEVVGKASLMKLLEWIMDAQEVAEGMKTVIPQFGKRGQPIKPKVIKCSMEKDLARIQRHMMGEKYKPWEQLEDALKKLIASSNDFTAASFIENCGPWPMKGIPNMAIEDAVQYGCSDADDTLRLALEFERMVDDAHSQWQVAECDRDRISPPGKIECRQTA